MNDLILLYNILQYIAYSYQAAKVPEALFPLLFSSAVKQNDFRIQESIF